MLQNIEELDDYPKQCFCPHVCWGKVVKIFEWCVELTGIVTARFHVT